MAGQTHEWILTDVDRRQYVETWSISNEELGLPGEQPWSIHKRTLRGGLSDGVDIVAIDNGVLSLAVLPTRGMSIWKGSYRGTYLGWNAPIRGPVHPAFVDPRAYGGVGWIEGFDEWIVRCGLQSNGAPGVDHVPDEHGNTRKTDLTLHGNIANTPAFHVAVRVHPEPPYAIEIVGKVEEAGFFLPRLELTTTLRIVPGANTFSIHDRVTNRRGTPTEMQLLYHCNFGPPLLEGGARFIAPIKSVAPRDAVAERAIEPFATFPPPAPGPIAEEVFFVDLHADPKTQRTLAMLQNQAGNKACALRFSKQQVPCFTLWKHPAAEAEGYVTGLEPATNFPNPRLFERKQGRVVKLAGGESYDIELDVEVVDDRAGVTRLASQIEALQALGAPTVFRDAQPHLTPGVDG